MGATDVERIVFFDGVCNLCNGAVQFVIRRDPAARFRFAPLQSPAAAARLGVHVASQARPDSLWLSDGGKIFDRSTAALRIARHLTAPWPVCSLLLVVPRPIRDWAYDLVARRRYQWFGQRAECMVPTPELRSRFLYDSEPFGYPTKEVPH